MAATVVAVLLERRPALLALRRALPARSQRLLSVRTPAQLESALRRQCIDAVILGLESVRHGSHAALRAEFPTVPLMLFAPVRPDDAPLVRQVEQRGTRVLIEGLDEPVLSTALEHHGVLGRRLAALLPIGDRLDLVAPLQRRAWGAIIRTAPEGLGTAELARRLAVSREGLSRAFGVGRAPTLKTAIDGVRLVAAGQLLGSPGYRVADAARLLGFSSASLLQRTSRRIAGSGARALGTLPPERILARLLRPAVSRWN